jgi:DNA-binding response OmpR family regulator
MKSHRRSAKASVKIVPLTAIPKEALADLAVTSGGNSKRSHHNGRSKQIKVLVIDDEESLAVAVARVLDLHGYRCFAVYNGRDAIAAAESFSPDVVLSDVMMDGTNGVDACMQIQRALPSCRILLYSAEVPVAHSLLADAISAGYNFELLAKPLEPSALVSKIETLFTGHHSAARASEVTL